MAACTSSKFTRSNKSDISTSWEIKDQMFKREEELMSRLYFTSLCCLLNWKTLVKKKKTGNKSLFLHAAILLFLCACSHSVLPRLLLLVGWYAGHCMLMCRTEAGLHDFSWQISHKVMSLDNTKSNFQAWLIHYLPCCY